jgi:hypothetical protein
MNHLTFKEHLFLTEARQPGVTYTEKQAKGALDRVTAKLAGSSAANMTKLAKRYARLEASMAAMKEKHSELNARLKEDVADLFNAEDVVLTRVVETAQFTLTMAKEIQKTEGSKEKDYDSIIAALSALISGELQPRVEHIIEKYTKTIPPKPPIKKLSVSKEITEGMLDTIKRTAASFLKAIKSWATRYDQKLTKLHKELNNLRERDDSDFL